MTGKLAYPSAHPPTGGGGIIWGPWIREPEGVDGREVRKWDIAFFSSSYHCHLLACLILSLSSCVSFRRLVLACRSRRLVVPSSCVLRRRLVVSFCVAPSSCVLLCFVPSCVSLLACRLAGPCVFVPSFARCSRVVPVVPRFSSRSPVVPVFASVPFHRSRRLVRASRLCLSGERGD